MEQQKEKVTSRAVLLPTPADPFLLYFWLNHYEKIWRDEVDKLYICVNGQNNENVLSFLRKLISGVTNAEYIEFGNMIDHGNAINEILSISREKHIMLIEDDAFVFRKGQVNKCFSILENSEAKVVASKRGSCSQEILDKAQKKYDLDYSGFGDSGCNFWPSFLFCERSLLLKTDREFGAKLWKAGKEIPGLGIAEDDCVGDTFVNTSLQIRQMVADNEIHYEPQYHGATDDEPDYLAHTNIWSPDCKWLHVGSLSSGYYGLLNLDRELPDGFSTVNEKLELERRVTFWTLFAEYFTENAIQKELADYKKAIHRIVEKYDLDIGRIQRRIGWYKEVLLWT